jgi:hypothetical protein
MTFEILQLRRNHSKSLRAEKMVIVIVTNRFYRMFRVLDLITRVPGETIALYHRFATVKFSESSHF